ncbi:hypothetical protein ACFQDD_07035, partial [Halorubrum pallidum]
MASTESHTQDDSYEQVTLMANFGPTVGVKDGEPVPPTEVAGYTLLCESTTRFRAESRIAPTARDVVAQRYVWVWVDFTGSGPCEVMVAESDEKPWNGTVVATAADKVEGVREAVAWMESNPAPDAPETVDRIGSHEHGEMRERNVNRAAVQIREGTEVTVDGSYPATASSPEEIAGSKTPFLTSTEADSYKFETAGGTTFELVVEQTRHSTPDVLYSPDGDEWILPAELTVNNEQNLRETVHTDTYKWLKAREGETVIHQNTDTVFEVVDLSDVRDGFVNPPSGKELDPESTRGGTYIDEEEAGKWFDAPGTFATGTYRVTPFGVAEHADEYGFNPVVDPDEWDSVDASGAFVPEEDAGAPDPTPVPSDRTTLSRDAAVDAITGIGQTAVEEAFYATVGKNYEMGFPVPFVGTQYAAKAVADLYTLPDEPTPADAFRAVIGLLGGVGYRGDQSTVTAATAITDTDGIDMEPIDTAWVAEDAQIKAEHLPGWIAKCGEDETDDGGTVARLGAGNIKAKTLKEHVPDGYEQTQGAVVARSHPRTDQIGIAGTNGEGYCSLPERAAETAAAIAGVDLSD